MKKAQLRMTKVTNENKVLNNVENYRVEIFLISFEVLSEFR